MLEMLKAKIHNATVTDANLNYQGSITISRDLMEEVGIYEYEKVLVADVNNGQRFETYVIEGKAGEGVICINGSASRLVSIGDKVIIMAFQTISEEKVAIHKPKIILMGCENKIAQMI